MSAAALQAAVVDELRLCAGGARPTMRELRLTLDCSASELAAAVLSLRYAGKLSWDGLELSPSMLERNAAPCAAEGGAAGVCESAEAPPSNAAVTAGPDDDQDPTEDYPGEVNDIDNGRKDTDPKARVRPPDVARAGEVGALRPEEASPATSPPSAGFVPKALLHRAGIHAASTRAGAKPLPAPEHEPELDRAVREEINEKAARRYRARSTGTVRQPLELKVFGIPDMDLTEALTSMLSVDPKSIMRAVSRKHPPMWRRVILLGRMVGKTPMQTLYDALERGLDAMEAETPAQAAAA